MRPATTAILCAAAILGGGCDTVRITTNSTSEVLARAQPAMKQESDYELARDAIPGSLKIIEGFHIANPDNEKLVALLAEGYCHYASGFVEDELEVATLEGDIERAAELSERASVLYTRCMNYGLELLGEPWPEDLFEDLQSARELVADADHDDREGLGWAAVGFGGVINRNLSDIEIVAHAPKVELMLERAVELDDARPPEDPAMRALPHLALGLMHTSRGEALGGRPEDGKHHFRRAIRVTHGKFLLPKALFARHYGVITQDAEFFRSTLVDVLETDPAIWPEQRLANEIAHRRAQRYLENEREWF